MVYTYSVLKAALRSVRLAQADKVLRLVLDSGRVNNQAHAAIASIKTIQIAGFSIQSADSAYFTND
jgi:hypothetical protein